MATSMSVPTFAAAGMLVAVALSTAHAARCDEPAGQAAVAEATLAVQAECDCAGATSRRDYQRCARTLIDARRAAGLLPEDCRRAATRCARSSTCGRPGAVTCCRTSSQGTLRCRVKRSAAHCKPPRGGSATIGTCPSCCQSCGLGTCRTADHVDDHHHDAPAVHHHDHLAVHHHDHRPVSVRRRRGQPRRDVRSARQPHLPGCGVAGRRFRGMPRDVPVPRRHHHDVYDHSGDDDDDHSSARQPRLHDSQCR